MAKLVAKIKHSLWLKSVAKLTGVYIAIEIMLVMAALVFIGI